MLTERAGASAQASATGTTPREALQAQGGGLKSPAHSPVRADIADAGTASSAAPADGRARAVIDAVEPQVDGGRFAAKCIAGEPTDLVAHCFADGHDQLRVLLAWRALPPGGTRDVLHAEAIPRSPPVAAPGGESGHAAFHEVEMRLASNDEWHAAVTFPAPGRYAFTVTAWVDALSSWHHDFQRRIDISDLRIAARVAVTLFEQASHRAGAVGQHEDAADLRAAAARLGDAAPTLEADSLRALALDASVLACAARHPDRSLAVSYPERVLVADRLRARYSSWYELFPRSAADEPGRHGTFADVEQRLPYVASMGFDVLYLPPIHPIGRERRKGRNNALEAVDGDVGSPWAIGAAEGGHGAIHPALGTAEDFRRLVSAARGHGIDLALDIALQCAPDHPWVQAHPQWFRHRPDGSIQYAENPPKKYQDIYPFDFETDDWRAMWAALRDIFEHWIAEGVTIFRVDNPHTKAFPFWEWCITDIKARHPEAIFLAEAFTRPKVMHRLAKVGFSQSYTYFTWRHSKHELTEYLTELAHTPAYHYFRPNFWPNTPDILDRALQGAGWAMFAQRLVLAATLCSNYGLYGPAYELMDHRALKEGGEEYLDSEKYQLRHWDLDRPDSLRHLIARLNKIRREHPALQDNRSLHFMPLDNEQLIAYSKRSRDGRDTLLVIVNVDAESAQAGWIDVDLDALGLAPETDYVVNDLLGHQRFTWRNGRNYVSLDPHHSPGHVFLVESGPRTEAQFDGY
ncbi:MAG TPA: alpha-1,4-glucan--maltose-1-phosphate maltosyltransferase [Burkholderiaceae bacterium]|nr:alpha-1,4-glucan--maltose-1-phosphate maltosyltransferase [Burkholderiaceae bacterium]